MALWQDEQLPWLESTFLLNFIKNWNKILHTVTFAFNSLWVLPPFFKQAISQLPSSSHPCPQALAEWSGHGSHWGASLNYVSSLKLGKLQVKPVIAGAFHKSQALAIEFLFLVSGSCCCFARSSNKAIRRYRVWWRAFRTRSQSCSSGLSSFSARRKRWETGSPELRRVSFCFSEHKENY